MGKHSFFILLGIAASFSGGITTTALAADQGQSAAYGSLSYSPDRWPSRWSAAIQQNNDWRGSELNRGGQSVEPRNVNPWAPESKALFDTPMSSRATASRPWGDTPREDRRERERTGYSREGTPYAYGSGFDPYYGHYMPQSFYMPGLPGLGYGGYPGSLGRSVMPGMGYPYLGSSSYSQPYRSSPFGLGRMGWPFSRW